MGTFATPLVTRPAGWAVFSHRAGPVLEPWDFSCWRTPNTLYPTTFSRNGVGQRPREGTPAEPYIWERAAGLPRLDVPLTQDIVDGVPRWIQTYSGANGAEVVDVIFPLSGQAVRAVGAPLDELATYLRPQAPQSVPALNPMGLPPGIGPLDLPGVRADVSRDGITAEVPAGDLDALVAAIYAQPGVDPASCVRTPDQWQVRLWQADRRIEIVVVHASDGCATAVSSPGGLARATPEFVALLERLG